MAPRPQAQRRNPQSSQNEHVYDLGVRGRKTGIMVQDTGERDEFGMEPDDDLFSSPEKGTYGNANAPHSSESDDEQDMEIDEASTLGPATVARMRKDRISLPKSRSPGKTFLNSPARHNPHIGRTSSPMRGSVVGDEEQEQEREHPSPTKSAKRRLDFSKDPRIKPVATQSQPNGSTHKTSSQALRAQSQGSKPTRVNGFAQSDSDDAQPVRRRPNAASPVLEDDDDDDDDEEEEEEEEPMDFLDAGDDDVELPDGDEDPSVEEEEPEEEPVPVAKPQPKKRGRKPKIPSPAIEESSEPEPEPESEPEPEPASEVRKVQGEPLKKKRGRPGKRPSTEVVEPAKPAKRPRGRPSLNKDKDDSNQAETSAVAEARGAKKQKPEPKRKESKPESSKPEASKAATAKAQPGRKRKSSNVGSGGSPVVPPRPPMPKRRSLVSQRRDNFEVRTTRSGRVSTKPLEFWRGEHYEYDDQDDEVVEDKQGRRIKIGSKLKGVVRVEYDEDRPKRRRGRPASAAPGRPKRPVFDVAEEEEEDREEWEDDPGRVVGECIYWHPDYEFSPPQDEDQVEVAEEEIAISEAAIQMKDIKDATFRFAKTLTLPFFGSGVVDLPPHSEKRTKNARKMQMVFFVHYGNVDVTVASNQFRITKGGTWFVPRGNNYSITNDTDKPARLFFCQGCEMTQPAESQEM
ncbi:Mif2/CENP-C like-domain-containing protein [Truncatella angustata]|uniref:CENP-C homolog n=1 Tax=Truncatella angustata TaxID=152316 RepID=A0A9P8ZZP7_9PEZI|nr:Mif2/CENP-C like-domain-containing protein [Truncatella angustata]KAH6656418.1 Mif2/CENP-C like-domain-containing protein [Truncatella angustata]